MRFHDTFERYLLATMNLCCGDKAVREAALTDDARLQVEASGLLEISTTWTSVVAALGTPVRSDELFLPHAIDFLRESVEHRFQFSTWRSFDFAIYEAANGIAWGHSFVRRHGVGVPPLATAQDARRWSHLYEEVVSALGQPTEQEGWAPWTTAVFAGDSVHCYVYGLLQRVEAASPAGDDGG